MAQDTTNTIDKAQDAINQLLDMFQNDDMPAAIARTVIKRMADDVDTPSAKWSLGNQLLMMLAGTEDARGFHQWQDVGRSVKKGAKSFRILAPRVITVEDKETGEKRPQVVGFLAIPVFRYEDTEGADIGHFDYTPPTLPPLWDAARALGVDVSYQPFAKDFYGYYQPARDGAAAKIVLVSHDAAVFLHELAHAAHKRPKAKPGQDPAREIVAEFTSAVLCRMYGLQGTERNAYDYIRHYAEKAGKKDPTKAVMALLSDVDQTLRTIFEAAAAATESAAD